MNRVLHRVPRTPPCTCTAATLQGLDKSKLAQTTADWPPGPAPPGGRGSAPLGATGEKWWVGHRLDEIGPTGLTYLGLHCLQVCVLEAWNELHTVHGAYNASGESGNLCTCFKLRYFTWSPVVLSCFGATKHNTQAQQITPVSSDPTEGAKCRSTGRSRIEVKPGLTEHCCQTPQMLYWVLSYITHSYYNITSVVKTST